MTRRGFMQLMLKAGVASFVVTTAGVLMPVRRLVQPLLFWGDGVHDDTAVLNAHFDGQPVYRRDGSRFTGSTVKDDVLVTNGFSVPASEGSFECHDLIISTKEAEYKLPCAMRIHGCLDARLTRNAGVVHSDFTVTFVSEKKLSLIGPGWLGA